MPRAMHVHENLVEVLLVYEGSGIYTIDNNKYIAKKGDIIFYNSGVVHDERMAVSPEDFLSYKIRIPSYSDQTFFYKKVQWLIKLSQNEMKLLSQYKKLRQYLLREMFI